MHTNYTIKESPPSAEDFASLRKLIGWSNPCLSVVQKSIDASLFSATIYLDNNLVGCGRVIGDGAMYFYIQDVIIHPEHQNKGLGSKIMNTLIAHLESCCAPGARARASTVSTSNPIWHLRTGNRSCMSLPSTWRPCPTPRRSCPAVS